MDYTKVPRELIFKDRTDLSDFFVDDSGTLDAIMYEKITRSDVCAILDAAERLLDCYNDAYYITTLILMGNRPSLYVARYLDIIYSKYDKRGCTRHFAALTMAMVYNYLQTDKGYQDKDNAVMRFIWNYHVKNFNDKQIDGKARFFFFNNVLPLSEVEKHDMQDIFKPRDVRDIVNCEDAETIVLGKGLDYVIDSIIRLRNTESAIYCFDTLIQTLKGANIAGMEKLIREVEDAKKEFRCIREEPPIRRGAHGNLIEQPQSEDLSNVAPCSKEKELETKVMELQDELAKLKEEKQEVEAELKEYMERNQNRRGINKHLVAHLGLKLAPKLGITYTNKKVLAPALSQLFGWGKKSLENELTTYFSDEDDMALAKIFGELSPDLAKYFSPKWEATPSSDTEPPLAE